MGILARQSKMSEVENKVTVAAFCRRRLAVVLTRLKMAETVKHATELVEQGHVRVGPEVVSDPAYLVTRLVFVPNFPRREKGNLEFGGGGMVN